MPRIPRYFPFPAHPVGSSRGLPGISHGVSGGSLALYAELLLAHQDVIWIEEEQFKVVVVAGQVLDLSGGPLESEIWIAAAERSRVGSKQDCGVVEDSADAKRVHQQLVGGLRHELRKFINPINIEEQQVRFMTGRHIMLFHAVSTYFVKSRRSTSWPLARA